jgi:putative transposase
MRHPICRCSDSAALLVRLPRGPPCIGSEALARFGKPGIFNTDQGAQFTSDEFTTMLRDHGIEISMDGRGRCHDNIFVERLWWTVKHEWVYLRPAANGIEQKRSLAEFFDWYNPASLHPSLYAIEEKRFC